MKFTEKWLKRHLKHAESVETICNKITSMGFQVEGTASQSEQFENFIVSEVLNVKKHPNAEKLSVCDVFDGSQKLQVICGAPNVRTGAKVVLASVGAIMPVNRTTIQKVQIRGLESNGMICSREEICLPTQYKEKIPSGNKDDIIELPLDAQVGESLAAFLQINDTVIDIAITPNRRQDGSNVRGIARDLYAMGVGNLISQDATKIILPLISSQKKIDVQIQDEENCASFQLQVITNIDQTMACKNSSYREITKFLESIGQIHENPLVNLSNFYMFDLGRPNHIYDTDKIDGQIFIRKSFKGEKFIPISMNEITLPEGVLVIADSSKILALAGIIGGELSKVTSSTKNIAIEVANFAPDAIINSGRTTNIYTESRFRFEGRVDQENDKDFIKILTHKALEYFEGELGQVTVVSGKHIRYDTHITFNPTLLKSLANYNIAADRSAVILEKLGFDVNIKSDTEWVLGIPSWRLGEITTPYDIVEEIIRIHGFEHIENVNSQIEVTATTTALVNQNYNTHHIIVETLLARGMDEVINWSFISESQSDAFHLSNTIKIINPITNDFTVMRKTMIPGLLEILKRNVARGVNNLSIFESGNIYDSKVKDYQIACISGLRTGSKNLHNIHKDNRKWDFYDVRDDMLRALQNVGIAQNNIEIKPEAPYYYHPTRSASIFLGKRIMGYCGELHPALIQEKKLIPSSIYVFEIFENNLPPIRRKIAKSIFKPSSYQAIDRDIAFIVNKNLAANELCKAIKRSKNNLIQDVQIFDIYEGQQIVDEKKSIAVRIKLQSAEKTLTEEEINNVMQEITAVIIAKFNATIRDQ